MERRLRIVARTAGTLAFAAAVTLWVRSLFVRDVVPGVFRHPGFQFQSCDGRLFIARAIVRGSKQPDFYPIFVEFGVIRSTIRATPQPDRLILTLARPLLFRPARWSNGFGFIFDGGPITISFKTDETTWDVLIYVYAIPYWSLSLLSGLFLIWPCFGWWRRRRRIVLGQCAMCGYDLRATPERCPECGTALAESKGPSSQESIQ
jgi:hypothetical protein